VAGLLILSIGIILAATLTPHANSGTVDVTLCDLSRLGPAPFREYRRLNDTTLNVLVFVPLGVAIAVVPRTGHRAALLGAAIALPFAIETVQLVVPWLARGCESADVVDNLTGLLLGLAVGTVAKRARHGMRGGGEPPG
jgi:hypothetical protein